MKRICFSYFLLAYSLPLSAQADNEIQVYASPTITRNWTIFELHSNKKFEPANFQIIAWQKNQK